MSPTPDDASPSTVLDLLTTRHLRVGWSALTVFVTFGIALEALHAWKAGAYLDVGNETRRLMWTLAHAHGVGLALLNIAYAATLRLLPEAAPSALARASWLMIGATWSIPLGFALGGISVYGGDPGPFVVLVALGAVLLWIGVVLVAREAWRARKRA
jgi:hypothetical protein